MKPVEGAEHLSAVPLKNTKQSIIYIVPFLFQEGRWLLGRADALEVGAKHRLPRAQMFSALLPSTKYAVHLQLILLHL